MEMRRPAERECDSTRPRAEKEETLWLVPSAVALWMQGGWNVRLPAVLEVDAGDSRWGVRVGPPGGRGVAHSMAGFLL